MQKTFIYCLYDPITDLPKYIGKSNNPEKRFKEHLKDKTKSKKVNWIKSLIKKDLKPKLEILDEVDENTWEIMESMYISLFRGWGFELLNLTAGGDGASCGKNNPMFGKKGLDSPNYGQKRTEETKKHLSERQLGENNSFYGKSHTEESLKKISQRSSGENNPNYGGKSQTLEFFKKQSISNSKKPLLVIDTITNEINEFINSKEAANFLNVGHSLIRTAKANNYKVRRRYLIQDKILCH